MACPAVTGCAALVRQYYEEGFYPTGSASPADALVPTGALVKATLLNGTIDMRPLGPADAERVGLDPAITKRGTVVELCVPLNDED